MIPPDLLEIDKFSDLQFPIHDFFPFYIRRNSSFDENASIMAV